MDESTKREMLHSLNRIELLLTNQKNERERKKEAAFGLSNPKTCFGVDDQLHEIPKGFNKSCVKDEDVECDCQRQSINPDLLISEVKFIKNPDDVIIPRKSIKFVELDRNNEIIKVFCNDGTEINMPATELMWEHYLSQL